jgi:hypothetical protein
LQSGEPLLVYDSTPFASKGHLARMYRATKIPLRMQCLRFFLAVPEFITCKTWLSSTDICTT